MTFRLTEANQTDVPITVVECDREDADLGGPGVRKVIDGSISELPPGLPSGQRIDLAFVFNEQGAISVHAELETSAGTYTSCQVSQTTGPEPRTVLPAVTVDRVHFAVTTPGSVPPGASFVIDVWAYLEHQRQHMVERAREEASPDEAVRIKSKGPVRVARGTILTIRLHVDDLVLPEAEDVILWDSEIGNASFTATVPEDAHEGTRQGTAFVYLNGLRIARIGFVILVGEGESRMTRMQAHEEPCRNAFASYASADRDAVLARVQGILKAAPKLDVFLDVLKLRSGEDWQKELWRVIPLSDVFYLFWSGNAANCQWVEKEWKCALESRGLDFIDPVPLMSPEDAPPPPELSAKHFNDWVLAFMRPQGGQ